MPTPEAMTAAVHAYVKAFDQRDVDAVVALFAENATVEDPIGTEPKKGRGAIREFYTASMATGAKLALQGPVRVSANYAAFAFQVQLHFDNTDMRIDVIDTFKFDDAGKVLEMRAFFGPGNTHTTKTA